MQEAENEKWMQRCLALASKGIYGVQSNPMVGSVVVHEGTILGEGYHAQYGEAHAEVNAIKAVVKKELLPESTLYVSLEPCAHFGKTPPCSDLIIRYKIPKVVIATIDPFSEVAGKGIEKLRKAGIEVVLGVLQEKARFQNRRFFMFHKENRPYIILKWAATEDGFIDYQRTENQKGSLPISQAESTYINHQWRAMEDAIAVGTKTVETDNPSLTTRKIFGTHPTRIVLDAHEKLNKDYQVFDQQAETLWITEPKNVNFFQNFYQKLIAEKIQSVVIEGGAKTHQFFIDAGAWDEIRIIQSNRKIGKGLPQAEIGQDHPVFFRKKYLNDTIIGIKNKNLNL